MSQQSRCLKGPLLCILILDSNRGKGKRDTRQVRHFISRDIHNHSANIRGFLLVQGLDQSEKCNYRFNKPFILGYRLRRCKGEYTLQNRNSIR